VTKGSLRTAHIKVVACRLRVRAIRDDTPGILLGLQVAQGWVGGPGAAGELALGDGGLWAQAEQVGHDGGRELAGELQEYAGAAGDRVDARPRFT
jgi:hypothetical protein